MKTLTKVDDLVDYIRQKFSSKNPVIIAVDGYGGSGKSTLCKRLKLALSNSMIIQTDDFIKYPHEPNVFEHDWTAIEDNVLKRLKTDQEVITKAYDWNTLSLKNEKHSVERVVLVDGIGLLDRKYSEYFDLKIWIDCPYEVALERGKRRDKEEQGSDHDELWETVWGPGSQRYFKSMRPDLSADILFSTY